MRERPMAWGVGVEEDAKEKRLALVLADGAGDFDFVRARAILNWVVPRRSRGQVP
jgi:hypothetical protein